MSTRGAIGFRIDGVDKLTYNHFDSYPHGLGVDILSQAQALYAAGPESLLAAARNIKMLNSDGVTKEVVEATRAYHNMGVSEQSEADLYCLFREAQGNLAAYLSLGYMPDNDNFILDSLFCEWAYILDLDDDVLEVYRGFQSVADPDNRYGQDKQSGYFPCKLILSFPLEDIHSVTEDDFLAACDPQEEAV